MYLDFCFRKVELFGGIDSRSDGQGEPRRRARVHAAVRGERAMADPGEFDRVTELSAS